MHKILRSVAVISALVVTTTLATKALWSDSGQSTGNVFQAGTLDLKLSDDDEGPLDNVTATWSGSEMTPGGSTVTAELKLRNVGNPSADHVHVELASTITEAVSGPGADTADPMDANLEITALSYDGTSILSYLTDNNANGYLDLDDWENTAAPGIGDDDGSVVSTDGTLPLEDMATDHPLSLTVKLHESATDANQGDTVTTVFTATLHQADGQ